jgi:hypothetical protein
MNMTKYVETFDVQPTATKTLLVQGESFSWALEGDRLAELGVVEVSEHRQEEQKKRSK